MKYWTIIGPTPPVLNIHTATVYGPTIFTFGCSLAGITQLNATDSVYSYVPLVPIKSHKNFIPGNLVLHQIYPNPFNPSTTIEFDLPKTSEVTLKIFNILGEEVATLVSDRLPTGSYSYEWDASNLASEVYLYRLQAGDYAETRKMVLMR